MINKNMEAYKIAREIKRSGKQYTFMREGKGEFGQPIDEPIIIGSIPCLYHETSSAVRITTTEPAQIRTKKVPTLLCLYIDVSSLSLFIGDYVEMDGKRYNVTGCVNIQLWGIISDISLEVVDSGIQSKL